MLLLGCLVIGLAIMAEGSESYGYARLCIEDGHLKNPKNSQSRNCRNFPFELEYRDYTRRVLALHVENLNIRKIESDAFTNVSPFDKLLLRGNSLDDVSFLQDLPDSITGIGLSSNNIKDIYSGHFRNPKKIETINLSDNQISELKGNLLHGCFSLTILSLKDNRISNIKREFFRDLKSVTILNLSNNEIASLDKSVFADLASISILDLKNNKLTTFNSYVFDVLPRNLGVISLRQNDLKIDIPLNETSIFGGFISPLVGFPGKRMPGMASKLCISSQCKSLVLSYNEKRNRYRD